MITETTTPNIEDRFTKPKGWRWHSFERIKGREIRFDSVFPQDSIPDAVVVCLQGVGEFSEKYFELARWCNENNMAFWIMDWAGQGKSSRYLPNPQKRHSSGFNEDIDDLHYLVMEYIKHSSVHPDKGRIPLAMMAHSMGANLGLHYLKQHPDMFECAAFSAPMLGIKKFEKLPQHMAYVLSALLKIFAGKKYVPDGHDWSKGSKDHPLSSDPIRSLINDQWFEKNPDLLYGDVTFGWLFEAQKSCLELQKKSMHSNITTPCLFGIPAHEHLVDNNISRKIIISMKNAKLIDYPDSCHEILMEKDKIRGDYLDNFYKLVKETIIDKPETLKPF